MHFETRIILKEVFRDQHRPGFIEPFHKVVFEVQSDGIDPLEIGLWVHRSYPDENLIKVGRSFLAGRLTDMVTVASEGAYTPSEVDALWQTVKPVSVL
ncbi:MAG: hypothetical protein KME32_21325 [Mojavia pulchra JT2-VF2]|jgi:hypothetical protein|uniref:Uncharacterized protein n=1 Tax=Mojavia pulchra JT2-VF2 TaxID=287848 RepID=A0A951Q0T6_9NOST|nr:hypothetical protein [Mojavia pulchra JT2-VF2]